MKKVMLVLLVVISAACCFSQATFQSPYKDGHAFPDSLKDYSTPKAINLLSAKRTSVPVKQDNKTANQQPGNTPDENIKPVVLSAAKKP